MPVSVSAEFRLFAQFIPTKTTNNGMSTEWKKNDKLNIFHAVSGTTDYVKDMTFTVVASNLESGEFNGTLSETLDASKSYDWYAFYPYNSNLSTPAGSETYTRTIGCDTWNAQTQNGNNSMSHLCGGNFPLYGNVKGVPAGTYPNITMKNVASVTAFRIKNGLSKKIAITKIVYFPMTPIVGAYSVNFTGDSIVLENPYPQDEQMTATLNITGNEMIEPGSDALFYIGTRPYTIGNGTPYMITVSVTDGEMTGEQQFFEMATSDIEFKAGKMKTKNLTFDQNI